MLRRSAPFALVLLGATVVAGLLAFLTVGAAAFGSDPVDGIATVAAVAVVLLAASTTLGALVLAAFALARQTPEADRAVRIAAIGAAVWTVASLVAGAVGLLGSAAWLATTLFAAAATFVLVVGRGWWPLLLGAVLVAAGLLPLTAAGAQQAEAGRLDPAGAPFLILLLGGLLPGILLALAALRPSLDGERGRVVVRRASRLLLLCSGGVVLVVLIDVIGSAFLGRGGTLLSALLGAASADSAGGSPAEILTGRPLPPPPTAESLLLGARLEPGWILLAALLLGAYLFAAVRVRRSGAAWSAGRIASWCIGVLVLLWATSGGPAEYRDTLFSAHLLVQMTVATAVPVLLGAGAPARLLLAAASPRTDGSRGLREWLLALDASRLVGVLAHPAVAAVLLAGSLWAFTATPLLRFASSSAVGAQWMLAQLLVVGCLLVGSVLGAAPATRPRGVPARLLPLLGLLLSYAALGLWLALGTGLLAADWYGAMGWDIGITALQEQQRSGAIVWAVGGASAIALGIAVVVQRARDGRPAAPPRRPQPRGDDPAIAEYERMLREQTGRRR